LEVVPVRERPPALMTVEEAARLLRVGRTKAYAMAREWRATGGRSGLPVVDFGHVLRVPRQALENLIGAELRDTADEARAGAARGVTSDPVPVSDSATAEPGARDKRRRGEELERRAQTPAPTSRTRRTNKRRQTRATPNQTTLPL
jgi:excisionase family DNA binding protein